MACKVDVIERVLDYTDRQKTWMGFNDSSKRGEEIQEASSEKNFVHLTKFSNKLNVGMLVKGKRGRNKDNLNF